MPGDAMSRKLPSMLVALFVCTAVAAAQPATRPTTASADAPAGAVVVPLWPDRPSTQPNYGEVVIDDRGKDGQHNRVITVASPTLTVFLPEHPDPNRPAIVICPGGGYVR